MDDTEKAWWFLTALISFFLYSFSYLLVHMDGCPSLFYLEVELMPAVVLFGFAYEYSILKVLYDYVQHKRRVLSTLFFVLLILLFFMQILFIFVIIPHHIGPEDSSNPAHIPITPPGMDYTALILLDIVLWSVLPFVLALLIFLRKLKYRKEHMNIDGGR